MRKFLFATAFAFLIYAISVNAASNFNIAEDFVNLTSEAGKTVSSSFTVSNNGTKNLNINFTGYKLTKGSDQLSLTSLSNITNIAAGASNSAGFSVVIPSGQSLGLYTGDLTAASNLSDTDTVKINVNVTPTYSLSTSPSTELNLGKASLNSTQAGTFNITNTGTGNLTKVFFDFSESKFKLKTNASNFTLKTSSTETIKFNITIPKDSSTGNVTLGFIKLDSAELDKALFSLKAEISGGLIIEDVDVFLTTRDSKSGNDLDVADGKRLNFGEEDAGPGSELRFNLNIENTFTDDEDIDINDITVKVAIEKVDDGDDLEEESNEFDLDAGENVDADVFFNIPLSVASDIYDVVIDVEGDDESGNTHTAQTNLKLRIDKESRAVIVSEASLFPEKVKCSGNSVLTATIKNIGSRTEDDAKIEVISKDLGISFINTNIELEEDPFDPDNEFTKKLTININRSTEARTYPIEVKSYIQEQILWEKKVINLEVEACADQAIEGIIEEEAEEVKEISEIESAEVAGEAEEEAIEGQEIPILQPATTTEIPLTKKPVFWAAVVLLNIIVIGSVAFLIVKAVGKK